MQIMISLETCGGPENLAIRPQPDLEPSGSQILIGHQAIGMNFIDVYHRKGTYPLASYPAVLGVEGAGTIEALGPDVKGFKIGDRVAYACGVPGAYASKRLLPAERAIRLPDDIPFKVAASSLLKCMTAYLLLQKTYPVAAGTTVLVHAAAGGLGAILVRWAKHLGATVIGTAGSPEKAAYASNSGADHMIVGRDADLVAEVRRITAGRGVDVVYDGIGGNMLVTSIDCVRPFGTIASIGHAAGPIPHLAVERLRPGKSLSLPSIMAYAGDTDNYRDAAMAAFDAMRLGIAARIAGEYPLEKAGEAHAALESGKLAGSLLLVP